MQIHTRERVIDGTLYRRHDTPYAHDLKIYDLGHGHTEAVILPRYGWSEACALSELALEHYREACDALASQSLTEAERLAKLTENRDRATRRARTKVRRLAKAKGLTTLMTLTYRENMVDRDRMQRDLDVFLKRVRRVVPEFQYIAVFERQKRGAWHAHLAVPRVLSHYVSKGKLVRSYDLLRSMWRAVVGADNGNVDVSRNKRLSRSAARLAVYISKYIGKTFDQAEKYVNAYSASMGSFPKPMAFTIGGPGGEAVSAFAALLESELASRSLFMHKADGGVLFFCLSPDR